MLPTNAFEMTKKYEGCSLCFASWIPAIRVTDNRERQLGTKGEYPGHSKNLNYIVSYFFEEHVSKSWDNN